jgi:hypothetical protein
LLERRDGSVKQANRAATKQYDQENDERGEEGHGIGATADEREPLDGAIGI